MAISFVCVKCNKRFNVRDDLAGKIGRCSNCGAPIRVPSSLTAEPPTAVTELDSEQEPDLAPAPSTNHHDDFDLPGPGAIDLGIRAEPIVSIQPGRGSSPSVSAVAAPPPPTLVGPPTGVNPAFPQRVVVVNVDMPFGTMVRLLVKLSLASIPATLIFWGILMLVMMGIASIFSTFDLIGKVLRPAAPDRPALSVPAPDPGSIPMPFHRAP